MNAESVSGRPGPARSIEDSFVGSHSLGVPPFPCCCCVFVCSSAAGRPVRSVCRGGGIQTNKCRPADISRTEYVEVKLYSVIHFCFHFADAPLIWTQLSCSACVCVRVLLWESGDGELRPSSQWLVWLSVGSLVGWCFMHRARGQQVNL